MAAKNTIADLLIKLSVQTDQFNRGLKSAESKMESFASGAKKILGGLAAGVSLYKFQQAIMGVIDQAADLSKMSEKIGIPMKEFGKLAAAAQDVGLSTESMGRGIKFLSKNMQEATQGGGETAQVFKSLNVQFESAPGKVALTQDVILQLADTFSVMDDSATKTALAVKLFGRSGIEMIPFLNKGREEIEELIASNVRMGAVLESDLGQKARKFKLTLNEIKDATEGLTIAFTAALLPTLQKLAEALQSSAEDMNKLRSAMKGVVDFIESGIVLAGITLFVKFGAAIGGAIIAAGGLVAALETIALGLSTILMAHPEIAGIMLLATALYQVYLMYKAVPPEVDKAKESYEKLAAEIKKMKPEEQKQQVAAYTAAIADMRHEIEDARAEFSKMESEGADPLQLQTQRDKIAWMIKDLDDYRFRLGVLKKISGKGIEAPQFPDTGTIDTLKKKMIELNASFASFGSPLEKSRAAFKASIDAIVEGKGPIKLYQTEIDNLIKKYNEFLAKEVALKVHVANIAGDLQKAVAAWDAYGADLEIDFQMGLVSLEEYYEERSRIITGKTQAEIDALEKERAMKTTSEERKVAIDIEISVKKTNLATTLKKEAFEGKKAIEEVASAKTEGAFQSIVDQNTAELEVLKTQYEQGLVDIQSFYDRQREIVEDEAKREIAKISAAQEAPGVTPKQWQDYENEKTKITARAGLDRTKLGQQQAADTTNLMRETISAVAMIANLKAEGTTDEIEAQRFRNEAYLAELQNRDAEEIAQLAKTLGAKTDMEMSFHEKRQAMEQLYADQSLRRAKTIADQEMAINAMRLSNYMTVAQGMGNIFGQLYDLFGGKVKLFFYLEKAMAIAEITIQAAIGAMKAVGQMGPLGIPMAEIIWAMAAANIAIVMAQTLKGPGMKKGGPITEGSGTRDDVPIRVMKGEYIQPKDVVQYYGMNVMEALRRKLIPKDAFAEVRKMAGGGAITEGSGVRDDVTIRAMRGEYVQTREAVSYYGLNVMEAIRRMLIPKDVFKGVPFFPVAMPGLAYATGGAVGGPGLQQVANTVTVPVNVYGADKSLASRLRENIEEVVIKTLREQTR